MPEEILVIDDDLDIRQLLQRQLESVGYKVIALPDGQRVDSVLAKNDIKVALVDLVMPGENGLNIVRRIRDHSDIGIIVITGQGETVDRVVGLELGADDYLVKPFDMRELTARVRALIRRSQSRMDPDSTFSDSGCFIWDGWNLDLTRQTLTAPTGKLVDLTSGDIKLLAAFAQHPNRVMSRDQLITLVSSNDSPAFDRSIDVRIARLRKKLADRGAGTDYIKTARNVGYSFAAKVTRS